jgi:hypothetical protein
MPTMRYLVKAYNFYFIEKYTIHIHVFSNYDLELYAYSIFVPP